MRNLVTAAALVALASTPSSVLAEDAAPPPEPSVEAQPALREPPPPPAWSRGAGPEQTLGFQVRLGGVDTDRALVGGALVATSGPFEVGLATDLTVDVNGDRRYHRGAGDDHREGWCHVTASGRCIARADAAFTAFAGLLSRTQPVFAGARLRFDVLGEVGWQVSHVSERTLTSTDVTWSEADRAYPVVGLRAGAGLHVFRAGYFGIGGFVRQPLQQRMCVTTDGGCTRVGGTTAGLVVYGGADFGAWR
jgi:hypothetical protein